MTLAVLAGVAWLIGGIVGQGLLWLLAFIFFGVFLDDFRPDVKYLGASLGFALVGAVWAVVWIWQLIVSIINIVSLIIGAA